MQKRLYKPNRVVLCIKRMEKTANIREMGQFKKKWQKWPPRVRYSLCKLLNLGQKLKLPKTCQNRLYNHIRVVLCKKKGSKRTANI